MTANTTERLAEALRKLLAAVKESKVMEGREYVGLGIEVNEALAAHAAERALPGEGEVHRPMTINDLSEDQITACRGLLVYHLGGSQQRWTLGQHNEAGGYGIPLSKAEECLTNTPKNYVVELILRIAQAPFYSAPAPMSQERMAAGRSFDSLAGNHTESTAGPVQSPGGCG